MRQNRCGQQPKWSQLGIDFGEDPLHLKNVTPLVYDKALEDPDLQKVRHKKGFDSSIDEMALALENPDLKNRWFRVKRWITVPQMGVPRGRAVEAGLTADEVQLMIDFGHCEGTSFEEVVSTCHLFPVAEVMKSRRRLIKHSKWFNETFGRETLEGIHLLRTSELVQSIHDGTHAITLDFSAWFDQFEMAKGVRPSFCFPAGGKWYRLTRLPMGMRQANDVAHTATEVLASFPRPKGVRVDTYVDNIRFLGKNRDDVIAAAATFIQRCRAVNATINEVPLEEDALEAATRLVATSGEFLGAFFNYVTKEVCLGAKSIKKLVAMQELLKNNADAFTHRNFLTTFGLLFYALQVTRAPAAHRYYPLKEYTRVSRQIQRDPGLLETLYKCAPSRGRHIEAWVADVIKNVMHKIPLVPHPSEADFILVTDASGWGWGACLLDTATGALHTWNEPWESSWKGRRVSSWSEPEGIARALRHFFPQGSTQSVAILSDSSTAVGAFAKGRSKAFAVNRALLKVQEVFPDFNASWNHIAGVVNPMDGRSRGEELGDVATTTAQVHRLAMGVPRDRGSQYQVESLESAKKVGHPLWLDNHVSRGASNVTFVGNKPNVGIVRGLSNLVV